MIEDVRTGRRIPTSVRPVEPGDIQSLGSGWKFEWARVVRQSEVYKLIDPSAPGRILGLIGLNRRDSYIEVTHLESNPDDVGRSKNFRGIAGSPLASAAQLSFEVGGEGFVAIVSKTELIGHYRDTYGFERVVTSQRMLLSTLPAARLIEAYGGR